MRVREVGARGVVTPAAIVDWMQEAAAHHCESVGWSVHRLRTEGSVWFVRELDLELAKPALAGETIEVETWVSDLRRFRTHREYLVSSGGEVVARAQADWLFLGRTAQGKLRPRRPPEAMQEDFPFDERTALEGRGELSWSEAERSVGGMTVLERMVMPSEMDENDHVNHTGYLTWMEDQAALEGLGHLERVRMEFLEDASAGDGVSVARRRRDARTDDLRVFCDDRSLLRAVARRAP